MASWNFQNVPSKDKTVKKLFKARPGFVISNADLGTAEVWVAGALSGDKYILDIFRRGDDLHSTMAHAARKLTCKVEDVKEMYPDERQAAKSVTFGTMYLSTAFGIFKRLELEGIKITFKEVDHLVNEFWKNCFELKAWFDGMEEEYRATGKLRYANGRLVNNTKVFSNNEAEAEAAVRTVLNGAIQGPSSDIMLTAITRLMKEWILPNDLIARDLVRPFTLVHDSITSEVHTSILAEYQERVKFYIQEPKWFLPDVGFPIGVDFSTGASWGDCA